MLVPGCKVDWPARKPLHLLQHQMDLPQHLLHRLGVRDRDLGRLPRRLDHSDRVGGAVGDACGAEASDGVPEELGEQPRLRQRRGE